MFSDVHFSLYPFVFLARLIPCLSHNVHTNIRKALITASDHLVLLIDEIKECHLLGVFPFILTSLFCKSRKPNVQLLEAIRLHNATLN